MALDNSRLYRELQAREAKIRRLVDANIVGVVVAQLDGKVLEANDAFLRLVGYTREDVTAGRLRWTELTPPEWQDVTNRALAQLRATGTCEFFEKEYARRDGTRVPVLIASAVIEATPTQAVTFVLDLTERRRLHQLEADLAYLNRAGMMGELAASLAHEVKQPLTAAVANAEATRQWLDRPVPDLARANKAATSMIRDATQAAGIIDRVRALFGRGAAQRELVDVNEQIREMGIVLHNRAARHRVSIRSALDDALPTIMGDPVQLQQVLMNLMLNGIEAMQERGGELAVSSTRTPDGAVLVAIRDEGTGLPAEGAERLFDAFVTTKPQGMGLGLSISRRIVEAHGGRLWATANPERGATFHFTLPTG
jgi:PAS domain S-box-containing protein